MDNSNSSCSCNKIVVLDYFLEDGNIYVKTYEDGEYNTVLVDIDEINEQIEDYLCYKMSITKDTFDKAVSESGINRSFDLLLLDRLEDFFVKVYNLNSFADILTDPDVNFMWRRVANGIGSMVFELKSGVRIDSNRLRNLDIF